MLKSIAIWLVLLVVVAVLAGVLMRAQVPKSDAPILSGADIGFRVEANKDGIAVGTLMVRINNKWVETTFSTSGVPKRLTSR